MPSNQSVQKKEIRIYIWRNMVAMFLLLFTLMASCTEDATPTAKAVTERDSIPVMTSYGVSKLISDSGIIRYKIIAEEWKVYDRTQPPRQTFEKGIFLEKFDEKFHIELYITADTAYWYNQNLWELRGRVFIKNQKGTKFWTDKLFWNMDQHIVYSDSHMRIVEPDQEIEGDQFRSNEQMTEYYIHNSAAIFPVPEENAPTDSTGIPVTNNE